MHWKKLGFLLSAISISKSEVVVMCFKMLTAIVLVAGVTGGVWAQSSADSFQPNLEFNNSIVKSVDMLQQYRSEVARINRSGAPFSEAQTAYERMVGQMSVPPDLSHLPFPPEDAQREWTVDAQKVAKGIKPNVHYQVINGPNAIYFRGTSETQKQLHDNVRIIAWYRDQMEKACPEKESAKGTYALAAVLDAFLKEFAEAIPKVNVKMSGKMNMPQDQRLQYSDREIWEMMSAVNRYFFYKFQLHEEVKEYYPADYLLMGSMVRTAAIYGSDPPPSGLEKIDSRLTPDTEGWRGEAYEALHSFVDDQDPQNRYPQQLCKIAIPRPAPPPAKPQPTGFPADVEDVREIGGQVYIKRNGYWSPWNK